jgi:polyferredoxin
VPADKLVSRVFRPRVLVYASVLALVVAGWAIGLSLRTPLKLNIIRDRAALVREADDGRLENVYRLQIMNAEERDHKYRVNVTAAAPMEVILDKPLEVPGAATLVFPVRVRAAAETLKAGSNPVQFHLTAIEDGSIAVHEKSVFFVR